MPNRSPTSSNSSGTLPLPMAQSTWEAVALELEFSPQQTRIVELILRGQPDKEIAANLGLTVPTVRTHLRRIFDRTGSANRLNLVLHIFALVHNPSG